MEKISKSRKQLINAGLESLASLEYAIKASDKLGETRLSDNMKELCDLIEKMMYCSEEEAEKNFDKIMKEMEDRIEMMVGQMILSCNKHGIKL
jgi:hypothetical protein